jgi:hypothetical protein
MATYYLHELTAVTMHWNFRSSELQPSGTWCHAVCQTDINAWRNILQATFRVDEWGHRSMHGVTSQKTADSLPFLFS